MIFHYYITLYYYANLKSSISCLFYEDIYLSFDIFVSFWSVFKCSFFECNAFEEAVILSAILLPIKSSVVFWVAVFEAVFMSSILNI